MISPAMNRSELRKMVDKVVRFVPPPIQISATGSVESDMNLWIHRGETPDGKGFEFLNAMREHDPFILDHSQIRKCDAPNNLLLFGQVILEGSTVRYEPFNPKPASLSVPSTSLHLLLEGADENGTRELLGPTVDAFIFYVANTGQQTVRDYRVSILVPLTFTRPHSGSYQGDLPQPDATAIGERKYALYEIPILQPIYKESDSIKIGKLLLTTALGDHIILWKIRCEDGVFPSETTYGEIKIRITSPSDLLKRAEEGLF
jgi:hypothetical protein